MNEHTLNPQQIIEAIQNGNIKDVSMNHSMLVAQSEDKTDLTFNFTIGEGEEAQEYDCQRGHIRVCYDFDLDEKTLLLLQKKALEELIDKESDWVRQNKEEHQKVMKQLKSLENENN